MNTLRLENINLHAPYRVLQDPERHNNFYFVSDSGARFDIDFTINESVIPSGAYEFGITNRRHERSPLDPKLRLTIFAIVEEFFEVNGNEAMLYLADTGDRKQAFRNRLFVRWFNLYEHRDVTAGSGYFVTSSEYNHRGRYLSEVPALYHTKAPISLTAGKNFAKL